MILYIKHIDIEGPGTLGKFFEQKGFKSQIIDLGKKDQLPNSLKDIEAVVVLGGPMNVYEEKKYPFLKKENDFLKNILEEKIPFLGICLGSQLLARAAGARVGRSPVKEVGFSTAQLSDDGKKDPLFEGVSEKFDVYQWHEDMFEVPKEGSLLAFSSGCPHQAFKVGAQAYGLQFHVEITDISIREWSDSYIKENLDDKSLKDQMLMDYKKKQRRFNKTAKTIYSNFLKIIEARKAGA